MLFTLCEWLQSKGKMGYKGRDGDNNSHKMGEKISIENFCGFLDLWNQ